MEEPCPKCGSKDISGLQGAFWRPLDEEGSPKFQWADEESSSEMTEWRCCGDCEHEWADDFSEKEKRIKEAGPELLAALQSSLERFVVLEAAAARIREHGIRSTCQAAIVEIRSAIAKAEGKEGR